jgi:sigma-B regulation protein RsbU (phosphoserine phosphatase)
MSPHRILIVDDEPINREILCHTFTPPEYEALTAENGKVALEVIAENSVDVVLLDVMMPVLDGFETCRRIKADPATAEIPVIFITALNDKKSKILGLESGASDFVLKPFDLLEIKLRVKHHLGMREMYLAQKLHNERTRKEILAAREIQANLLPPNPSQMGPDYTFSFVYQPCEDLGGDFLDLIPLSDRYYLFYITDISGHGIASSLITVFVKEYFRRMAEEISFQDPLSIIRKLNSTLLSLHIGNRYLTIFVGILDTESGMLEWLNAGANIVPYLLTPDGTISLLSQSIAIGWFEDGDWETNTIEFPPESLLLLYSDAAIEVKGADGEALEADGLAKLIEEMNLRDTGDLQGIADELMRFANTSSLQDDLTLIGVRRR